MAVQQKILYPPLEFCFIIDLTIFIDTFNVYDQRLCVSKTPHKRVVQQNNQIRYNQTFLETITNTAGLKF